MTYGDYLRFCRTAAGGEPKTAFARKLGLLDRDHYVGAENNKPSKRPSLDLMEKAAIAAGYKFADFIQEPKPRKYSPKHQELHDKLQQLLDSKDGAEVELWVEVGLRAFYKVHFKKR